MPKGSDPASAADAPREIELKLELDPQDAALLSRTSLVRGSPRHTEALSSIYFDTDNFDLRDAGLSLRVREMDGRRIQTLKAVPTAAAGLFDREEWEQEIDSEGPDLAAAVGTALEPLLDRGGLRDRIRPIFAVRVDRTTYALTGESWAAELTLDKGTVEAEGRSSGLCEIEIELTRGAPADLFTIARSLSDRIPVRLGVRTKAERGYALLEGKPPKAVKAKGLAVSPGMTTASAFQAIGRACLHHLLSNERLLAETRDPDVVHQMRVAMRRLRAALSLFREVLVDERWDSIRGEMKWISNELGAARDADVFIAKTLEPVRHKHPDAAALATLADVLHAQREQAYERALAAASSKRFREMVIETAAWIEAGTWLTADDPSEGAEPIEGFAARALARRRKTIKKRGADLAGLDDPARHQVRIAVKKLRYAAEFFSPLYGGRKAEKRKEAFLSALESLQEHLGELNDLAVAQEMHPDLFRTDPHGQGGDPDRREAARLILDHQTRRTEKALKPALKAYREFAGAKPFWT